MGKVMRLSDAERQRQRRARAKLGEIVVRDLVIDPAITAKLCAGGYLGEHELEDKAAVAEAIIAVLHDYQPPKR
jgi:hypothetical protein